MTVRAAIQNATNEVKPSAYLDHRLYLDAVYLHVKQHTEHYSYLKFSEDLGYGATTVMHQVIRGDRPLTLKAATKIARGLGLDGDERRYFLTLVEHAHARSAARKDELFQELVELKAAMLPNEVDRDTLAYFSEWYHPVVRELVARPGFKGDPEWIVAQIMPRIKPAQAHESLELLLRLGLVEQDAKTRAYRQTAKRISTGSRVRGMALTRYHQVMIELGKEALTRVEAKRRDISAITVNVDEETAQRLKGMIHAFQSQLLDEAERHPGDQVYQVNVQLFPFTLSGKGKAS